MAHWRNIAITAIALAVLGTAHADTLKMEGASGSADASRPTRGMTQARVEARYGSPVAVKPPVGDPPITRWEYKDFIVYFEYDKVIHAVTKR